MRIKKAGKDNKGGWYEETVTILNSMRLAALENEFENPISMDKFNQMPTPASENDGEVFCWMMENYKIKVNVFAEV